MKREYGIDLMRVFGMILVIIGHIVGAGGVVEVSEIGTSQHYTAVFLQAFSMCSINIFGLISGYVSYGKKLRIRSLINAHNKAFCSFISKINFSSFSNFGRIFFFYFLFCRPAVTNHPIPWTFF